MPAPRAINSDPKFRLSIVGGGIGGLTAAIALGQAGIDAGVYEQATQLREIGAGITLQINAMRALAELGIAGPIASRGQTIRRIVSRTVSGKPRTVVDMARFARELGAPCVTITRAALQQELLRQLGPEHVELNARAERVQQRAGTGRVIERQVEPPPIALGLADGRTIESDGLIGADGVHSATRRLLNLQTELNTPYHCWRALSPLPAALPSDEGAGWWGRGAAFGCFPVSETQAYWYFTERRRPDQKLSPEKRDTNDDHRAMLLAKLRGWDPATRQLIEGTAPEAIHSSPIFDRPATPRWGRRHVTLLGDAAHPMTPSMGQGGCMAIEDAVVLARCLAEADSVEHGMRTYEQRRWRRAARMVLLSRRLSAVAHASGPPIALLRHVLGWMPSSVRDRQLRKLFAFEVPDPTCSA